MRDEAPSYVAAQRNKLEGPSCMGGSSLHSKALFLGISHSGPRKPNRVQCGHSHQLALSLDWTPMGYFSDHCLTPLHCTQHLCVKVPSLGAGLPRLCTLHSLSLDLSFNWPASSLPASF